MSLPIYLNGRFLTAPQTGVQRVARELVLGLDQACRERGIGPRPILLCPEGAAAPELAAIAVEAVPGPRGTLWEQTALWRRARDGVLVNLANTAPLRHRRSILMVHDAQVFESPRSYSRAFRAWYRFLQPRAAARAARLLTVSAFSGRQLAKYGVRNRRPVVVVPNGVDHILRAAADGSGLAAATEGAYLLGFASAQAHKNVGLLLRAFADPRLADLRLLLVGQSLPAGSAPPANVRLLGRIEDRALRYLYEGATAFLFPSRTEGFGLPPGEAMACGCPVIAAAEGAPAEIYAGAAWLLDPDDLEGWIAAIRALAGDAERRAAQAGRGRARASALGWRAASERLAAVIEEVAGEA